MAKEIRGHAMPDPEVYVPPAGDEPAVSQGGGFSVSPFEDKATDSGPHPGAGYAFTAEQLQSVAGKWEALGHRYRTAKRLADVLGTADGPGAEYASMNNAEKVRQSGQALLDALDERVRYCREMEQRFKAALGRYTAADDDATAEANEMKGRF